MPHDPFIPSSLPVFAEATRGNKKNVVDYALAVWRHSLRVIALESSDSRFPSPISLSIPFPHLFDPYPKDPNANANPIVTDLMPVSMFQAQAYQAGQSPQLAQKMGTMRLYLPPPPLFNLTPFLSCSTSLYCPFIDREISFVNVYSNCSNRHASPNDIYQTHCSPSRGSYPLQS